MSNYIVTLPDAAVVFLAAYAVDGLASVEGALQETGFSGADFRDWCQLPAFADHLHEMFASLEKLGTEPLAPFAFPPLPPIVCDAVGVSLAIDPYGPLFEGRAYNHAGRCFANGKRMSEVSPSEVEWFNAAASWPKPTK
jgi:hypothetical protein